MIMTIIIIILLFCRMAAPPTELAMWAPWSQMFTGPSPTAASSCTQPMRRAPKERWEAGQNERFPPKKDDLLKRLQRKHSGCGEPGRLIEIKVR